MSPDGDHRPLWLADDDGFGGGRRRLYRGGRSAALRQCRSRSAAQPGACRRPGEFALDHIAKARLCQVQVRDARWLAEAARA
jgi:hypothetical protein